jgi:hypothetical protein
MRLESWDEAAKKAKAQYEAKAQADTAAREAERINEDLTVFLSLGNRETITGFKIKNVQRILEREQPLNLKDAPGLDVLILPILRRTLAQHPEITIKLYEVIIAALVRVKISLTSPAPDDSDLTTVNC